LHSLRLAPDDFYRSIIEKANQVGVKTILDASNEALNQGIKGKPYIIKPNLRELSNLAGMELRELDEIVQVSREIITQGVEVVIVSLGEAGACLITQTEVLKGDIPKIDVENALGSSDAMTAGIAVSLTRGKTLKDMFRFAVACGMANTQFRGIGIVEIELVKKFFNQIRVFNC